MFEHGIVHSDYHLNNFIIDDVGVVLIIDLDRQLLLVEIESGEYISNHQPKPQEEYIDIKHSDEKVFGKIILKFIKYLSFEGYISQKYASMLNNNM